MEVKKMSLLVKDLEDRLVEGWANVEIKDLQGDFIPIDAMKKAMIKFVDRGGAINYRHTNHVIGKVLSFWVDEKDNGVKGVKILAKIYRDDELMDKAWEEIQKGEIKGFSIGGVAKEKDDEKLTEISIHEISLVEKPANPEAVIEAYTFAKGDIKKKIESTEDLLNMARELLEEAKKVRGFVENRDESGAYYGMADDIVNFLGALIGDITDGKVSVEKGLDIKKDCKDRYMADEHHFKEMTCPDNPDNKSRFCGCVRYQMNCNGKSLESARAICAKIYHQKYGGMDEDVEVEGEVEKYEEVQKPFGAWKNFQDCVDYMMEEEGYDEDVARKVCGKLQAKLENKAFLKSLIAKLVLEDVPTEKFIYDEDIRIDKEDDGMVEEKVDEQVEKQEDDSESEASESKMDILLQSIAEINDKLSSLIEKINAITSPADEEEKADNDDEEDKKEEEEEEEEEKAVEKELKKGEAEFVKVETPAPNADVNVNERESVIRKILKGEISIDEALNEIRGGR